MDDAKVYAARIDLGLERLHLRSELYKVPDNVDDRVATIIEQAGKTSHGSKNKQRALLIEACMLLAQDAFQVVLDSENPHGKIKKFFFLRISTRFQLFSNWKDACESYCTTQRIG